MIKSGEEMLRSGNKYTLDHQSGILSIHSVSQAVDKGVYTCTVRDRQGHTARRDFMLDVVGKFFGQLTSCPFTILVVSGRDSARQKCPFENVYITCVCWNGWTASGSQDDSFPADGSERPPAGRATDVDLFGDQRRFATVL